MTAADRERERYRRRKEGRFLITIEIGPDLVDALETAYGVDIDTPADAAAVIARALALWESNLDRMAPHRLGDQTLTRQERADESVLDPIRKEAEKC